MTSRMISWLIGSAIMLETTKANKWAKRNYFNNDEEIKASLACEIQSESHLYDLREL